MNDGLRILLTDCIDYAGIFPPAQLSLKRALRNYVQYLQQPEVWMLGRFVCPAAQLPSLGSQTRTLRNARRSRPPPASAAEEAGPAAAEQLGLELVHRISVIGTGGDRSDQLLRNTDQDIQGIVEFQNSHGTYAKVETLELKLSSDLVSVPTKVVTDLLDEVRQRIRLAELRSIDVFVEFPFGGAWESSVLRMLEVIESRHDERFGVKIRTGGVEPSGWLMPEQVAYFIVACHVRHVIWKATAGLHRPLSRFDASNGTWQFGFLNLLCAAVFASVHNLRHEQITPILTETTIARFTFADDSISWGDYRATLREIQQARRQSLRSFGSCSFDEPRAGLRDLTLIT